MRQIMFFEVRRNSFFETTITLTAAGHESMITHGAAEFIFVTAIITTAARYITYSEDF
ncbi:MAG: hypothetical protein RRY34_07685 [Victivallaceae bacterium]